MSGCVALDKLTLVPRTDVINTFFKGRRMGRRRVDLLCSRIAMSQTPLVGRAQWKITQPPSLKRETSKLGGSINKWWKLDPCSGDYASPLAGRGWRRMPRSTSTDGTGGWHDCVEQRRISNLLPANIYLFTVSGDDRLIKIEGETLVLLRHRGGRKGE